MFLDNMQDQTIIHPASLTAGLYIVATPLGNLRDITLRALDVLASVDVILCEDTRISGKLTQAYGIATKRMAYHEHNAAAMRPKILAMLSEGKSIGLISDAGTPLISDPGMPLVRAARADGHYVTAVPGASAPIAALSIAGLPTDRFLFAGFLPTKQTARRRALQGFDTLAATLVFFESARRMVDLLHDIDLVLGARDICIARELTKKFEELVSGSAATLLAHFENAPPRGEFVILVAPGDPRSASPDEIDAMLGDALSTMSRRDAVQAVAEMTGLSRKQIYAQALNLDKAKHPSRAKQDQDEEKSHQDAATDETPPPR